MTSFSMTIDGEGGGSAVRDVDPARCARIMAAHRGCFPEDTPADTIVGAILEAAITNAMSFTVSVEVEAARIRALAEVDDDAEAPLFTDPNAPTEEEA